MCNRHDLKDDLEQTLDRVGLDTLFALLAEICQDKAGHVASTWQDRGPAQAWAQDARVIEHAATKLQNQATDELIKPK